MASRRWWRWIRERRLTCKDGHHIPSLVHIDESSSGSVRCNKWLSGEQRECGHWIWIMHLPGGGNIVADVTLQDIEQLKKLEDATERISFLGIFDGPPAP